MARKNVGSTRTSQGTHAGMQALRWYDVGEKLERDWAVSQIVVGLLGRALKTGQKGAQ